VTAPVPKGILFTKADAMAENHNTTMVRIVTLLPVNLIDHCASRRITPVLVKAPAAAVGMKN
jgi:hypothetical protein